jgi:predicted CoA-substrate-specific enzyme activase
MYSIGIDIGYSSIKITLINDDNEIQYSKYLLHKGKIREEIKNTIQDMLISYNIEDIQFGAITGSGGKILTKTNETVYVNEVAAIVEGSTAANKNIRSIIEIGGESAKYITNFTGNDKSMIEISMNSNCSAGTGSYLEEQMSRLNLRLEDYSTYAIRAKSIPRIAGRCSVFAKTDITHHQQEGVPVPDILLGLAYALVRNYKGTVMKKLPVKKPILFIGGVTRNEGIVTALKDVLKLDEEDLIIPEHSGNIAAFGAAVMAKKDRNRMNLLTLLESIDHFEEIIEENDSDIKLKELLPFGENDSIDKHVCKALDTKKEKTNCYLGVDVGSTSTNLVFMDEENNIIAHKYLRTLGNPVEAVRKGLQEFKEEFEDSVNVVGAGTTGSGRYMIGELIGADVIKDEITAQAKAATTIDSSVDTIFEIGGQDSKYISIEDGVVIDFQMNKICAAGTGSFIEEQAKKFNIPIDDFGSIALDSKNPINLGERCTVFIESSIATNLSRGKKLEDIASGLCYSIVKNYIGRVVGQKKIGNRIFLQGGVGYNQGIVNAFRAITGKDIIIPPFFSVTGAYGAAILTKEELGNNHTKFKGFDIETREKFIKRRNENKSKVNNESEYNRKTTELLFKGYDDVLDDKKKTVGIPRALFAYGMFSMFYEVFKELGFNVLLTEPTSEENIRLGQQYTLDEACYPMKIIMGHVAELVEKKVDYIFFPDLFSVDHPGSESRVNYGCPYMQMAFKVINEAMDLQNKGIELLAPTIGFNLGKQFMMSSFAKMGKQLNKAPEQMYAALQKGVENFHRFEEELSENGKKVLETIKPDEKAFVIISKLYGVADPILNMGIPSKLMDMGYKVISFYDLPEVDMSKEHPNMFWPFGQHILEPAKFVKQQPNLYAILLTHHGCGPDSVVSHYFREEMNGKPYLHIEVDEHSSGVGVITRVEAFINSLKKSEVKNAEPIENYLERIVHEDVNIKNSLEELKDKSAVYLPYMYPYSEIFKTLLVKKGINARVLPATTKASIDKGRKFTITEEYFSLTALLGDVFKELNELEKIEKHSVALLIPQNEGTETNGQYGRLLRTKLDEEGFKNVDIVSPFIEDTLLCEKEDVKVIGLGLLAGDLIRTAHKKRREKYLLQVLDLIKNDCLEIINLENMAKEIYEDLKTINFNKRILAVGENMVLYNDFLNNLTFTHLEDKGHRVVYSPFSEIMALFWNDFAKQNGLEKTSLFCQKLNEFKDNIKAISELLSEESPFEKDFDNFVSIADETVGYYSGANGRYREAKILGELNGIDGIMTVASMYENTGIVMNALYKGFSKKNQRPLLNLTFDGNKNENDETKIESFMYYL